MKITYLKVENVRCIDSAEFKDLGNIIVIVGPNGSGKSALFEAIRVFKSSLARYSRYGINLHALYPNFVNLGKDQASITLELSLTDEEKKVLNTTKDSLNASIAVDKNLSVSYSSGDINLFQQLFSPTIFSTHAVGKFEHIPSDRRFGRGQVSGISFSQDLIEQDRHKMFDDTSEKFNNLKPELRKGMY
ncbi:MAG: AAA family ATPase [Candidatus Edwardsbacteria bacterium]